jgi:hypothetical protein
MPEKNLEEDIAQEVRQIDNRLPIVFPCCPVLISSWLLIIKRLLWGCQILSNDVKQVMMFENDHVYLANTKIHESTLKNIYPQRYFTKWALSFSTLDRLDFTRSAIRLTIFMIKKKYSLLQVAAGIEVLYVVVMLTKYNARCPIHFVSTFELGFVGIGGTLFCKYFGAKSEFIQHGFINRDLKPILFDSYLLWSKIDKDFFESALGRSINASVQQLITARLEHDFPARIAFLLEYPTKEMPVIEMVKILKQIISSFQSRGWEVLLRPHPRDRGEWYTQLLTQSVFLDKCPKIEEMFEVYRPSVCFSFSSASLVLALRSRVLPMVIENPNLQKILPDYLSLFYTLKDVSELSHFFDLSREDVEDFISDKLGRLIA